MEKFVVSRSLAEKLRDAGFPQNTTYLWAHYINTNPRFPSPSPFVIENDGLDNCGAEEWRALDFCAPMTDELLEQLPDLIGRHHWLRFTPYKQTTGTYLAEWMRFTGDKGVFYDGSLGLAVHGDTPANTLAEMWLLLRDRGYALPCGINQSKTSEAA